MTAAWILAIGALSFAVGNAAAATPVSDPRRPSLGVAPEIVITAKRETSGPSTLVTIDAITLAHKIIARDPRLHQMPALHVASAMDRSRLAQNSR